MTAVEEERRGAQDVEFFAEDRRAVFAILMMRGAVLALVFFPYVAFGGVSPAGLVAPGAAAPPPGRDW